MHDLKFVVIPFTQSMEHIPEFMAQRAWAIIPGVARMSVCLGGPDAQMQCGRNDIIEHRPMTEDEIALPCAHPAYRDDGNDGPDIPITIPAYGDGHGNWNEADQTPGKVVAILRGAICPPGSMPWGGKLEVA
ncbi:MAG: hypothetical protein WC124_02150 [Desulfoplanes sp.]